MELDVLQHHHRCCSAFLRKDSGSTKYRFEILLALHHPPKVYIKEKASMCCGVVRFNFGEEEHLKEVVTKAQKEIPTRINICF